MSIKLFTPNVYVKRVTDIPISFFDDIKVVYTDADNTLTGHDSQEISPDILEWIDSVKACGKKMVIVSNNSKDRCEPFAQKLDMEYIYDANKPIGKKLLENSKKQNVDLKDCVFIGDQFFTDLLCSKNANIKFVLVDPLFNDTKGFIVFKRFFEKPLRKCLQYTKL